MSIRVKQFLAKKHHAAIGIAIAVVVLAIVGIIILLSSLAMIGDRTGAASDKGMIGKKNGSSSTNGPKVDCSNAVSFNQEYYPWVKDAAEKYLGGDEAALIALIQVESSWNPQATYGGHASGLGQFIASTARGYPEFVGGDDKHGITWSGGKVYDISTGHNDDARFDPKRAIYGASHLFGGNLTRYGSVGAAYQEGYHGYCKNMSKQSCVNQLNEAKQGRERLERIYNELKSGKCTVVGGTTTDPSAPINGQCMNVPYIQQGGNDHAFYPAWCSRASQAMVTAYFNPDKLSYIQTFAFQNAHKLNASVLAQETGKKYVGVHTTDIEAAVRSVKAGYPVIVYTRGAYGNGNHLFVLTAYDEATQTFSANDTFGGAARSTCISKVGSLVLKKSELKSHLYAQSAGQYFILVEP